MDLMRKYGSSIQERGLGPLPLGRKITLYWRLASMTPLS